MARYDRNRSESPDNRDRRRRRSRTPPRRRDNDRDNSMERERGTPNRRDRGSYRREDTRDRRRPESDRYEDRSARREVGRYEDRPTSRREGDRSDRSYGKSSGGSQRRRFASPDPNDPKPPQDTRPYGGPRGGPKGGRRTGGFPAVNHEGIPPFMLRLLVKHSEWHEEKEFDTKNGQFDKLCENDEIQVYAWLDSNLRTVVELTQDVRDEDRNGQHNFHMRIVHFDKDQKPTFIPLPTVHATYRSREDNITLGEKGFVIGDLIDICVTSGKHSTPGGSSLAVDTDTLMKEDADVPMMKEERRRESDESDGDREGGIA